MVGDLHNYQNGKRIQIPSITDFFLSICYTFATTQNARYEKAVVGINLLRLIRIGGPSQTRTGDLTIMSRML
jgi:hypothetical protein